MSLSALGSCLGARMKFWQRCLILGSSFFLLGTLYYYTLLDGSVDLNLEEHRRSLEGHAGTSSMDSVLASLSTALDPAVCAAHPGWGGRGKWKGRSSGAPFANLSTVDVFHQAHFNVLADGMYELPAPPPEYPRLNRQEGAKEEEALETLNVIIMPHSHVDPGWQKTTNEYYIDQTKHIFTNMVNKLTEHPDLAFVWAETIYLAMWWNELEDAVKVHVRRLIRRGQLEIAMGGWVMPDEASTHYVSVVDQLREGHQWLWENLKVKPQNSWSIDPFGYSGTMPYLWKLAGMDNMVIQRVHQAVKSSLMTQRSMEFYWRQFWDARGDVDILCHIMPYMLYSIKFSCGPNRFICLLFDFRSVPGDISDSRAQAITPSNVEKFSEYLYKQFRQKSYFYKYNTILVPVGDDFRYDHEMEWEQQHGNYSLLMNYMNNRKDWKINARFGTLKDYFRLTRQEQLQKKYARKDTDFPVLSGDFFPYSDRNLDFWTGYYTTRPFDKRFQREVQGLIQAADITVSLTYALYKRWGLAVQEKFFHLASLMQAAHRGQAAFLHHDAITGTSKDFVVVDFESQLLGAYKGSQSVLKMALQALVTKGQVDTPYVFEPETQRDKYDSPPRKVTMKVREGGTTVLVTNPLPRWNQQPVTLLVDSADITIKDRRRTALPVQLNPVWDLEVTGVKDGVFEVFFIADLPPLATLPFVLFKRPSALTVPARVSVFNSDTLVVPPGAPFLHQRPQPGRQDPVAISNDKLRVRVNPVSGSVMDLEDKVTGKITTLDLQLVVLRSQASGAYLLRPQSGSKPLMTTGPEVRVVEGPLASVLTIVSPPYVTTTLTLYHRPALMTAALHLQQDLNIQTLPDREVVMRLKTDVVDKKAADAEFFADQNGMQFIKRRTNQQTSLEANYYPVTSAAFLEDDARRLTVLTGQPHGAASLDKGWLELMLDRHLLYDDGRGLEEGVTDIKPVSQHFTLMVETIADPSNETKGGGGGGGAEKGGPDYAYPSLLSLSLSDSLQQPALVFYSTIDSDVFFNSILPMQGAAALPCDVTLLSLRSLSNGNLNYNHTSLLLHRRPYDCRFPPTVQLPCATSSPTTFQKLFKDFGAGATSVRETSLTHLHHKRAVPLGETLQLRTNQIAAYLLTL